MAFEACVLECEARCVGADPLPSLHLTLVALFRDLPVEIERCKRMDEIGSEALGVDLDPSLGEALPMRVGAFTQAGHYSDPGDPDFARRLTHWRAPRSGTRGLPPFS